jgi:hypothetical protein
MRLQPADASANLDGCKTNPRNDQRCHPIVSGNVLTSITFPATHTQRLEREEITRHGQTAPQFHPPTRQASVAVGREGDGGDWIGMGPQRGRVASPRYDAPHNGAGTHRPLSDAAAIIHAARLRDLLASIEEFWRASGPDRVWWRADALWRLAEWRTRYRNPERAAFQAAVAAQHRRTA